MSKYVVYVTSGGRMATKRVVTNGRVQKAFKKQIGEPMAKCMVKAKGVSNVAERKEIVKSCAATLKGTKLDI